MIPYTIKTDAGLRRQARGAHTEDLIMGESDIDIVQSVTSQRLRLIVRSRDGCTLLSQQCECLQSANLVSVLIQGLSTVAEDCLRASNGRPNFKSTTYVVQVVGEGTLKVGRLTDGFEILEFLDVQSELQALSS